VTQLCNKCGLFERTHSRPRPDQFPHKRGPLANSSLRGRTPPQGQGTQLPPISAAAPYQYHHGHLTPLNPAEYHPHPHQLPHPNTLPGLQSWHGNNSGSSSASGGSHANGNGHSNGASSGAESASAPPHLSRRSTQDNSPRMNNNASSSSSRSGRGYNEPLSSNNANHSRPPSPPQSISRSSTSHDGQDSGTPPPARDPPA